MISAPPDLTVIIPAYNEAERLGATIRAVQSFLDAKGYGYEVIVCADGDDGGRDIARGLAARDPRLTVLGSAARGGKGRAIREGVRRARGRVVGFVDADYKTPIEELPGLLIWLEQGYDIAIGSRGVAGARIEVRQPLHRRLGSRAFGLVMHALVGLRDIRDTQCGFKFFLGDVARTLFARQRIDGYMFDVEVLHLARRHGYRIKEVGVRWRDDRDSRLQLVAGNWRNAIDLLRIRFGSDAPAAPDRGGVRDT